jgi:class 3 adenylate cyclase
MGIVKTNRRSSIHPFVKQSFWGRCIFCFISIIPGLTIFYYLHVDLYLQVLFVTQSVFWPFIALYIAQKNATPKETDIKLNFNLDLFFYGFWFAVSHFNPIIALYVVVAAIVGGLSVNGFQLLFTRIIGGTIGATIGGGIFGFQYSYLVNLPIIFTSSIGIISITFITSFLSYRGSQIIRSAKKQLKEQKIRIEKEQKKSAEAYALISKYVAPQLADTISAGEIESIWQHNRKKLTLFFSDIKDFTKITDALEPEDMARLLNEYLTEMNKIINIYQGTLAQVIGDGLYIFFGAPKKTNDKNQAIECLKMAINMQLKMKELNKNWYQLGVEEKLQIRCGINTGMATVGGYGSSERKEYTAMGMQVNIAARIESVCPPRKIMLNHTTWVLVKDEIPCFDKGLIEIKGYHRPINVYEVDLSKATEALA